MRHGNKGRRIQEGGWRSFSHYKGRRIQDPALAAVTFNLQDLVAGIDCWRIKAVGTPSLLETRILLCVLIFSVRISQNTQKNCNFSVGFKKSPQKYRKTDRIIELFFCA